MYSSAIAPSRHLATVTMRPAALELACPDRLDNLHRIDVPLDTADWFLTLPVDQHVLGVMMIAAVRQRSRPPRRRSRSRG